MKTMICGLCALLLMAAPVLAETSEVIGQIRTLKGSALVERNDIVLPAAVGMALHRGDLIRTGTPGAAGIVLTDDTTLSLGSGSELVMKDYAFDPKEGRFASVMRMVKGSLVYISGMIARLAPHTIEVQTPDAAIAVRGTKLLVEVRE
jgi:hypothetical protein